jgi:hypothetical protein
MPLIIQMVFMAIPFRRGIGWRRLALEGGREGAGAVALTEAVVV